ncbi:nucleolar complex protein, putative [Candida dubliniensis CD36]|uniref:Nucleolar complex protein, putative n=1 Tax=Candida dubliniensis (strain CD36 / ATCC MYA-646 / CBS 7987 / NCPF 3949 / NRRL Y-17841) TaxID=573826 RepID=B9WLX8_CANDC|nr:nucleolar complex protein, putative [Candida dubliniensis CD36]CAX40090.1 nucleolar complex protein, putative [Candida dubliniensis CD36]
MGKASKQTKKFQNKHLKHTIEQRKKVQAHNKKIASRKKGGSSESNAPKRADGKAKEVFEDMSVDDFFEGGFEVPKEKNKSKNKNKNKQDTMEENEEDSSSEEEDEEAMKENLKKLEAEDPEFYKYLKDNDNDLLDFEAVNPLDAISDDEDDDEGDKEEEKEEKEVPSDDDDSDEEPTLGRTKGTKIEITKSLVKKWNQQLDKPTPKIIRNILIAFKAAVNIHNSDSEDYKFSITDPKAFSELMLLVLKKVPISIQKLVKYKTNAQGVRTIPQKNQYATQIAAILKSHAGSFITLLNDITNTETAALILASIYEVFPFYLSHRRLLKQILSAVVNVWSSTSDIDTQISTFAFLNNVSREYPKSVLETVLKLTYSSFLQNCRKTNVHTMAQINFCKNSAVELFGINETLGYQVGFEYVRQLAIHLRNSINATSNAKEGYKTIYNWQYCHSLDFWSRVLSQHCNPEKELQNHKSKESPLRQLIYPLVQVTLGAIRLIPTAQFFPLRFYLIRSLIRLSQSTGVFIPLFPLISEILSSTAITKAPRASTLQAVDFEHNIKVNQAYLGTRVYQDGLCEQFIELSGEFFGLYTKSIAFPELVTPAVLELRRFVKKSKNVKFNKQLQQLIEKLNANAVFITGKRSNVEYGPSNKAEVQQFLNDFEWEKTPLGQYVNVQRQMKAERLRILKEAQEEEARAQAEQKKKEEEEEEKEDEDIEMEVEDDE